MVHIFCMWAGHKETFQTHKFLMIVGPTGWTVPLRARNWLANPENLFLHLNALQTTIEDVWIDKEKHTWTKNIDLGGIFM